MSDTLHVELTGMPDALRAMQDLGKVMERRIVRKGLRAGCKVLKTAAQSEAPEKSGLTKRSIKVRAAKGGKGVIGMSVGLKDKDYTGETFYAAFVLYGHRVGSRKLGDARAVVPGNNFLKRAFDGSCDRAAMVAVQEWRTLTEEAAANKGK